MLDFTKEAVHEVVAAKVSQMEACEHQEYLLQELQLDDEQLRVLNETQFLGPLKRPVVGTLLVVDRKTNAVCGVRGEGIQSPVLAPRGESSRSSH